MTFRTDHAVLKGLLDRVRAAKWPDRELDGLIIVAAGAASEVNPRSPTFIRMLDQRGRPDEIYSRSAEVSSSLDAALELVERILPGWQWMVRGGWAKLWTPGVRPPGNDFDAFGATPALALCAALLTALLAQTNP